ncbi:MAG: efflux RND transporter periplasmic adaptor subunit [Bacteroidales bacterium]|nr:efflux RND transporter periplasmic adaptor subunit [Bacteroidales bacterium]
MKKQTTLILILSTLLLTVSVGCNRSSQEQEAYRTASFFSSVKTELATLSYRTEVLMLTGQVETNPRQTVNFIPLVPGTVDRVFFSLGDRVRQGQNLISFRSADLSELYAEKISAQAELRVAQREYQTARALFEDNMLSERELLEVEAEMIQAQAEINHLTNTLSIYGVDSQTGLFFIRAPISGHVLTAEPLATGSNISDEADEPLFIISDLSSVWVTVNVNPSILRFVRVGMNTAVTTVSHPGEVFHGTIDAMTHMFDPEYHVLRARVVMQNPDLMLIPGMFVDVQLTNETGQLAVTIPSDALIFDSNRHFVVVQTGNETFESREVTVQGRFSDVAYITDGLSENEAVVVRNQLLIHSSLRAR